MKRVPWDEYFQTVGSLTDRLDHIASEIQKQDPVSISFSTNLRRSARKNPDYIKELRAR